MIAIYIESNIVRMTRTEYVIDIERVTSAV